jgi:hypothetical protein
MVLPSDTTTSGYLFQAVSWDDPSHSLGFVIDAQNESGGNVAYFLLMQSRSGTSITPGLYANILEWGNGAPDQPCMFFGSYHGVAEQPRSGWFDIFEFSEDSDGTVLSEAVDFGWRGDNIDSWEFGSFRYNSDYPLTVVPEPTTFTLLTIAGIIALIGRKIHRKRQ